MKDCFRLLGLSDNATKEQVKAAYERKVERFKGADYADEPEYAHRKLTQLKGAYEEALRLAKDGTGQTAVYRPTERETVASQRKTVSSKSSKQADEENNHGEKFHQWLEQRDEDKVRKKNKTSSVKDSAIKEKIKKPDLAKLKESIKNLTEDEELPKVPSLASSDDESFGHEPASAKDTEESGGLLDIAKTVISLLIIGMTLFGSCADDEITSSDYDYISDYEVEEVYEIDQQVSAYAEYANALLYEQELSEEAFEITEDEEDFLRAASEEFIWHYWDLNKESVEEVSIYLYDSYADYMVDDTYSLEDQLESIFVFYGFAPLDEAIGRINPFTERVITNYTDYLWFLTGAYEEKNGWI